MYFKSSFSILILFFSLGYPTLGFSSLCDPFNEINREYEKLKSNQIEERIKAHDSIDKLRIEIAKELNFKIFNSDFSFKSFKTCSNKYLMKLVMESLTPYFNKSLFEKLKELEVVKISKLVSDFEKGRLFTLNSEIKRKGAFHHESKKISINITDINFEELIIIAVHELVHLNDEKLLESIYSYSKPETFKEIQKILLKKEWSELTREEKEMIDNHAMMGLDKGINAEFRAWWYTIEIYQELGYEVDWMEELIETIGEVTEKNLYQYLLNNSKELSHDFYLQSSMYRKRTQKLLNKLRRNPPSLEYFEAFFKL